jgi:hypothetical protein
MTLIHRADRPVRAEACEDNQHYACEGVIGEVVDLTTSVPACGCTCHEFRAPAPEANDVA